MTGLESDPGHSFIFGNDLKLESNIEAKRRALMNQSNFEDSESFEEPLGSGMISTQD
jgi:hypothetical protein